MSFDREGFKPEEEDQAALLTRAVSSFAPKKSIDPLVGEVRKAEDDVAEESKSKDRKLTRGKVSSDLEQRHRERFKIKPSEEKDVEDEVDEEEEDLEVTAEDEEEFDEEEFEEDEFEEDEEDDFSLDLANPTVRMLVEQNQRLMKMVESRGQEDVEQRQEDATLALGNMSNLISEDDLSAAQDDPKAFLDLFTKVIEHMGTRILQAVPQLVNKSYSRKSSMDRTVENFFSENPQLQNSREYVGFLAQKVSQELPNASAADILVEAGRRAYKELGLKPSRKKGVVSGRKKKGPKRGDRRQNAAFARTPRGKSRTQPKTDARNNDQKLIDRIVASASRDNR